MRESKNAHATFNTTRTRKAAAKITRYLVAFDYHE